VPLTGDLSGYYSDLNLGEISFKMLDGDKIVNVKVSDLALKDLGAQDGRQDEERTSLFVAYREQVESIARDKYDAGEWDGKAHVASLGRVRNARSGRARIRRSRHAERGSGLTGLGEWELDFPCREAGTCGPGGATHLRGSVICAPKAVGVAFLPLNGGSNYDP
jgi:hypothetical protein